jgi:hypothetical protein
MTATARTVCVVILGMQTLATCREGFVQVTELHSLSGTG